MQNLVLLSAKYRFFAKPPDYMCQLTVPSSLNISDSEQGRHWGLSECAIQQCSWLQRFRGKSFSRGAPVMWNNLLNIMRNSNLILNTPIYRDKDYAKYVQHIECS